MSDYRTYKVPGMLVPSVEGEGVTAAEYVKDLNLEKNQEQINKEVNDTVGDKDYNAEAYSGLGRKHLRKNIVNGVNTLTQSMMSDANTIYVIQYDFTLGENITIPANCVLEFDGGSISGAHTFTGNNTSINAELVKIFDTDTTLTGTWNIDKISLSWFGSKKDDETFDNAIPLKCAIKFSNYCHATITVEGGTYYFLTKIDIDELVLPDVDVCAFSLFGEYNRKSPYNKSENLGTTFIIDDDFFMYTQSGNVLIQGNIQCLNFLPSDNVNNSASIFGCSLRGSVFAFCILKYFFSFIHNGGIFAVTRIINNDFVYFKHLFYNDTNAVDATLATDSDISGNYINGSIKNSCMFYGGVIGIIRFSNNFVDFFKYIVGAKENDTKYISNTFIVTNNIFDYCYSFCEGTKQLSSLTFTSNKINKNSWDLCDSTWFWAANADASMKDEAWVFFRPKNKVTGCLISNNAYEGDFLFVANDLNEFLATIIKNNDVGSSISVYIGNISATNKNNDIDGWNWDGTRRIAVPLPFVKMGNCNYTKVNCSNPAFVPSTNLSNPYAYLTEIMTPRLMGEVLLNYVSLHSMWGKLRLENSSEYVTYHNDTILCAKSKSTDRVTQCSYTDAYTLYNLGLIDDGDTIYLYNICTYLKVSGVTDGHINGNVVGDILHPSMYGSTGVPLIKDENTPVINNLTVLDGGQLKRYNNGTFVNLDNSNGSTFYFKSVESDESPNRVLYKGEVFYNTPTNKLCFNSNTRAVDVNGFTPALSKGSTNDRPTTGILDNRYDIGFCYYDTTLNKPIFAKSISNQKVVTWAENDGANAGVNRSGTFAQKPAGGFVYPGFAYFCTDKQTTEGASDGIMIYYKGMIGGSNVWVDALGRVVS